MQLAAPEAQTRGVPYAFLLMVGAARGGVLAVLPLPADGQAAEAAARHPGVTLSAYKSASPVHEPAVDGSGENPIPNTNDVFYISGGSPEAIRRLASDMAGRMARGMAAQEGAGGPPKIPVFVRDQPGLAAHALSEAQQHDLAELMNALGNLP